MVEVFVGVAVADGKGVNVSVAALGGLPGAAVMVGMAAPKSAVTLAKRAMMSIASGS